MPVIRVLRLRPDQDQDIPLPRYMTPGSAGMDVCAAISAPLLIEPGEIKLVPTGFAMAIPKGFEVQARPRSGLAIKHGITLPNAPGTIDSDYRGEVMVALINLSREAYTIRRGERIAQLVAGQVFAAQILEVDALDETPRGAGGFGHTGKQ